MPEKKRKVKKVFVILLILVVLALLGVIVYFGFDNRIRTIYISGNSFLSDQEIIETANLEDYPNFYKTTSKSIRKKIESNPYIKSATVTKTIFFEVKIAIEEHIPLFIRQDNNTIVLDNQKEIPYQKDELSLPILINYVPDVKYEFLINRYTRIDHEVRSKISEIKYDPNEYDEDRFLLYMNDKNYVYVTLTKLELLNKYNDTVKKLEGKKGILYLDSGSFFEIKE